MSEHDKLIPKDSADPKPAEDKEAKKGLEKLKLQEVSHGFVPCTYQKYGWDEDSL